MGELSPIVVEGHLRIREGKKVKINIINSVSCIDNILMFNGVCKITDFFFKLFFCELYSGAVSGGEGCLPFLIFQKRERKKK